MIKNMDRNEIPFDLQSGIYLYPWKHLLHWRTKSKNTRYFFIVKSHMMALKRLLCVTVQNPAITMMNSVNLEILKFLLNLINLMYSWLSILWKMEAKNEHVLVDDLVALELSYTNLVLCHHVLYLTKQWESLLKFLVWASYVCILLWLCWVGYWVLWWMKLINMRMEH